jgi:hypothetical protein
MIPEARTMIIEARKKQSKASDDNDKSVASVKSLTKTVKSPEKSNRKLKKSVSALQKCEVNDDTDSSLSSEGKCHSRREWKCCKNATQKLSLPSSRRRARILTLELSFCWTTSQRLTFVVTRSSRPRSSRLATLSLLRVTKRQGDCH